MSDDACATHLALLKLHAAGGATEPRRQLLDLCISPEAALAAGRSRWRDAGMSVEQMRAMEGADDAACQHNLRWLQQPGHHLVGWHDPDYPPLLRRVPSPPLMLFMAGDPAVLWHPSIAIVGSRRASAGGRDNARDFARSLAESGFAIASGLAAGIDTEAHHGALAVPGGLTIAVIGTGPDIAYPRANTRLQARVAEHGVVVSEHPPGAGVRREHFPSRNRILAGLSLGTLVIEATERSGALITARQAAEAGREVFAVPGSIHNPMARGCHRLIRDGAALVERADEVITAAMPVAAELAAALRGRLDGPNSVPMHRTRPLALPEVPSVISLELFTSGMSQDYQRLWEALGHDPTGMDQLVERTRLTAADLSSMLLVMELENRVAVEHGRYSRKSGSH
ncbi:MAG: DNA-processing protein DprA [Pseudomonadota bacterium]|nr:DNA-processing protein DprA [Pseudomonadota bacterium]